MKHRLHTLVLTGIAVFWGVSNAFGELKITFPSERAVFQRDKNNRATIYISGLYTKTIDRVDAKLVPINGGEPVDWTPIQSNLQGGSYSGSLPAKGGWYRLEIRGWKGDQIIDTRQVERVGVGEVFMIAGQSNGQGYLDFGSPRADDDRVSCIDYENVSTGNLDLPYPQFSHVEANSRIAPRGQSSWSWGRLGDILARKYNVPVLFYNVAWYGSAVRNWRESIDGSLTRSVYAADAFYLPVGSPYSILKKALQYYVPITGIRGILWLQGESDNDANTSADSYFADLKAVIDASRNDSGKNLSWMISNTSYNDRGGFDPVVIEGQNKVISSVSNVFAGPNTDAIQIPRVDGVHFRNEGLSQLGDAWGNPLNDDFLARSEPYPGVKPLAVTISCAGNGAVDLSFNGDGLNSYSWNSGQNSASIRVGNGSYRASARDNSGNIILSPEIQIFETIQPPQANISLVGSNPICKGNSATLISSIQNGIRWNTGHEGDRITINTAGEYFLSIKGVYGCETQSARVAVSVYDSPLPEKPSIQVSGAVTFCDGGEVKLTSTSKVKSLWSNGSGDAAISVRSSGDFRVMAVDDKGCFSPESDVTTVKVNPLPARPVIALSRSSTFCVNESVTMTSNYGNGNTWSTSASSREIVVNTAGNYSLKQTDGNGCESTSDVVTVIVNPLPATPTLTALRPTVFCERDFTILQGSEAYGYQWSNGANSREIQVGESGDFTVSSRDANGCISIPSQVLKVTRNPLPSRPIITADGPTTFCADLSVNLSSDNAPSYLWNNGATTKTINIRSEGAFSVRKVSEFNCISDPSDLVNTHILSLPASPEITALGATVFCDGNTVSLIAAKGNLFFWNEGTENATLVATRTGSYMARVRDELGCYSPYSAPIAVEAKPNPEKPGILKTAIYTLQSNNNLTAGKYLWRFNNTALQDTTNVIKANQSGSYTVSNVIVYSQQLTCSSPFSDPYTLTVNTDDQFVAYPNPSIDGRVTIETLQNLTNVKIQVIDLKGTIHRSFTVSNFKYPYSMNLSPLANGLYLIRFSSQSLNEVQKINLIK